MARRVIYVRLLREGASALRPAEGIDLGGNVFRLLPVPGYDPRDEPWEFPPGSLVRCEWQSRDEEEVLVAKSRSRVI